MGYALGSKNYFKLTVETVFSTFPKNFLQGYAMLQIELFS